MLPWNGFVDNHFTAKWSHSILYSAKQLFLLHGFLTKITTKLWLNGVILKHPKCYGINYCKSMLWSILCSVFKYHWSLPLCYPYIDRLPRAEPLERINLFECIDFFYLILFLFSLENCKTKGIFQLSIHFIINETGGFLKWKISAEYFYNVLQTWIAW